MTREPNMEDQNTILMHEAVERETKRTTYPQTFPALPEVPIGRYFEPAFYDLEIQHVWRKTWLCAAHTSELPDPGSYKLFEQFGLSVIISRGVDNQIRAFHNICRHRGAALVLEPKGTARRFICPYHAWGYNTDGKLASVPESHNFACLDKAEHPLKQIRCEIWRGFIFVNLDDKAGPLADFMAPITARVADFPLDDMVVKDIITVEV